MRDLEARAEQALGVFGEAQPVWKMIQSSLEAFSGLELGPLSRQERAEVEGSLSEVNAIFSEYQLESHQDYQKMSYSDQFEVLTIVAQLCESIVRGRRPGS